MAQLAKPRSALFVDDDVDVVVDFDGDGDGDDGADRSTPKFRQHRYDSLQ